MNVSELSTNKKYQLMESINNDKQSVNSLCKTDKFTLHKKLSFPLRMFSVNVTKSQLLKKYLIEKSIFCAVSKNKHREEKCLRTCLFQFYHKYKSDKRVE